MKEKYVKYKEEEAGQFAAGFEGYTLFTSGDTPVDGCYSMLHILTSREYSEEQAHEDNEGFFVARGYGTFKVAGKEYPLRPGCAMYAPAGTLHAIKSDGNELEVFIYHFPA